MAEVLTTVVDLLELVTDVPAEEIGGATRFDSLAGWTSLAALRLLTSVEDRFGLRLDLRAYFAAAEVADLVTLISEGADRDRASRAGIA